MIRGKQYIYHVIDNEAKTEIIRGSPAECGDAIGVSRNTIRRMANGHEERRNPDMRGRYSVYAGLDDTPRAWINRYIIRLSRTGELIAEGTAEECMEQMGIERRSNFYKLVAYARANAPYTKYIVETVKGSYL